ncbi:SdiA-regulated domain-containing protein [Chryseobacterium sp.]|uniref:SdiA-regulated domain-containing protein n=1 Tax=Chryseobacterium sp. TaxID=1871047 RepID=UPI00388F3ECE
MRIQIITVLLLLSCNPKAQDIVQNDQLKVEFSLPKKLKEVSGITLSNDQQTIWAIEDQGNKNSVFALDRKGNLLSEIVVENAENTDWEDISKDKEGNLYIGDFGNNENDRKNLSIVKLDLKKSTQTTSKAIQTTKFSYEGQTEFPPKKSNLLYDCEAFVEKDGMFYLFTKNRSKAFDGTFLIFQIPNKEGDFEAKLVGKLKLEGNYDDAAITSASINSKNEIVLLTHRNIHLLTNFTADDFSKAKIKTIALEDNSQKEAIVFLDDTTLLIADEKDKKTGGNVYQFKIN